MLADGSYEAMCVDVTDDGVLSIAIVAGAHKGDVVEVRATGMGTDVDLLAMPCVLTVKDGQPSVVFD